MGDVIYPGIYLNRIHPSLTIDYLKNKLTEYLTQDGEDVDCLDEGGLQINRKESGYGNADAVLTGINLSFNDVRDRFKRHMLGERPIYIYDVYFGIERNHLGVISNHMDLQFHRRLKEGQTLFREPIKVFSETFKEKVMGGAADWGQQISMVEERRNVDFSRTTNIPGLLSYNFKEKISGGRVGLVMYFMYALDAIQAMYYLNGDDEFSTRGVRFVTPHPTLTLPGRGLGNDGELINFKALMIKYGYIPFNEMKSTIFDQEKIQEIWKSRCSFCPKFFKIIGISPDLNWLAGTCGCDVFSTTYAWPGDEFFRLTVGFGLERRYDNFRRVVELEMQPLVLLVKGLTPLYSSIKEFQHSAFASEKVEFQEQVRALAANFQMGHIAAETILVDETTEEEMAEGAKKKILVNMQLGTTLTDVWGPGREAGKLIRTVILIPQAHVALPNPTLYDLEMRLHNSARGTVHAIYAHDEEAIVELRIWVKEGFPIDEGETFWMIPCPPTTNIKTMEIALTKWKTFFAAREKLTVPQSALIVAVHQLNRTEVGLAYIGKRALRLELELEPNWIINEKLANKMSGIHFGINLEIDGRKFNGVIGAAEEKEGDSSHVLLTVFAFSGQLCSFKSGLECEVTLWMVYGPESMFPWYMKTRMFLLEEENADRICNNPMREELSRIFRSIMQCPFIPKEDFRDYLLKPSIPWVSHSQQVEDVGAPSAENLRFRGFLNTSQAKAVVAMLRNKLQCTEGPPGCGKTYTCCMGVLELSSRIGKGGLIVCVAQTNLAADVLTETLFKVMDATNYHITVRRMMERRRETSVFSEDADHYIHTAMTEHEEFFTDENINLILAKKEENERAVLTEKEQNALDKHFDKARNYILDTTDVVVCTISSAVDNRLATHFQGQQRKNRLKAIFMDESNLVTVLATLPILCLNPPRMWMLGDFKQLSPVFTCRSSVIACGELCWMRMLTATDYLKKEAPLTKLNEQYRFPDGICKVVSEWCYEKRLKCSETVLARPHHPFHPLFYEEFPELHDASILRINYDDPQASDMIYEASFLNDKECSIIHQLVKKLVRGNVPQADIAILPMYNAQLMKIKSLIGDEYPGINVCTVNSFGRREASVVIVSMVRCNPANNIGFLRETNRTNVAISRAKNYLFFVSSEKTFINSKIPDVKKLYDIMDARQISVKLM